MNSERNIVNKLFESKEKEHGVELEEAGFEANGSQYSCAFGHYTKDGEPISREEYFRAQGKRMSPVRPSSKPSDRPKGEKVSTVISGRNTEEGIDNVISRLGEVGAKITYAGGSHAYSGFNLSKYGKIDTIEDLKTTLSNCCKERGFRFSKFEDNGECIIIKGKEDDPDFKSGRSCRIAIRYEK